VDVKPEKKVALKRVLKEHRIGGEGKEIRIAE
jgi:hypothetical protein